LVDRRPQGAGNSIDADADAELQGVETAAKIEEKLGNLEEIAGHGLEFVAGGDRVRQADTAVLQMGGSCGAEAGGEQGTDAAGAAGADDIGHDDGPGAFGMSMHKYVQL
jgi:hypothetical protein